MSVKPQGCVARTLSERGEVVLLRRERDGALELRVNGVFVMDTVHTESERLLAETTLRGPLAGSVPADIRVFVGGLGMGFTLQALLADDRVTEAHVAEIEPAVVEWNQRGLITETAEVCHDPRVRVSVGDIRDVLAGRESASIDIVLLDVDNGPGYLVYADNAAVYGQDFLALCADKLSARGLLAVWSSGAAPELAARLRRTVGSCAESSVPVVLGGKDTTYHLLIASKAKPS